MNPRQDVVFLVNYDILTGGEFTQALMKYDFDWIILDESHRIKSPTGKISKNIRKLSHGGKSGKSPKVLCLTGTPMPHSFLDIWAQMYALNPKVFGDNFFVFKHRYALMGGYKMKEVKGLLPSKEDIFYNRCSWMMHQVATEDAIDLPSIMYQDREIELPKKLRNLHDEMMMFLYTELKDETGEVVEEISAQNALVKLLRMQQITSGLMTPDETNAKIKALTEIIEDSGESHTVVFYRFVDEGNLIDTHLTKAGYDVYHVRGDQNVQERMYDLGIWRANGGVLAVQIQAGGQGIDPQRGEARHILEHGLLFRRLPAVRSKIAQGWSDA